MGVADLRVRISYFYFAFGFGLWTEIGRMQSPALPELSA